MSPSHVRKNYRYGQENLVAPTKQSNVLKSFRFHVLKWHSTNRVSEIV